MEIANIYIKWAQERTWLTTCIIALDTVEILFRWFNHPSKKVPLTKVWPQLKCSLLLIQKICPVRSLGCLIYLSRLNSDALDPLQVSHLILENPNAYWVFQSLFSVTVVLKTVSHYWWFNRYFHTFPLAFDDGWCIVYWFELK